MSVREAPDPNLHTKEDLERAYAGRDWRDYRWLVAVCIQHSEPGLIVDLGAGLGFFVEACARYGLPAIGLEGSGYAVEAARARYPMDLRLHYLSQPLPFDDDTVATVVCNQTIEHVTPAIARWMLQDSLRVLRPGGLLAVYSPSAFDRIQSAEPSHINLYTPATLRSEVLGAGFREYRAIDVARPILGESRLMCFLASLIFRCTRWDRLSSSANCLAFKP